MLKELVRWFANGTVAVTVCLALFYLMYRVLLRVGVEQDLATLLTWISVPGTVVIISIGKLVCDFIDKVNKH